MPEIREHCAKCDKLLFGNWLACDRTMHCYCPKCFDKTPCGKGRHGEGCATLIIEDTPVTPGEAMTTIGQKADYVRSAIAEAPKRTGHRCHWPGCVQDVSPAQWGCRPHWYRLPQELRNKIWAAFWPGQEISKTPNRRYVEVAREVRDWIAAYEDSKEYNAPAQAQAAKRPVALEPVVGPKGGQP